LWAEGAIRRILDEVCTLFPLKEADEAIVHKCFSDISQIHQEKAGAEQLFKIRTLYDLESVLIKSSGINSAEQDLQRAFAAARAHFADTTKLRRLEALAKVFGSILEYELTTLFQDWYAGSKGARSIPRKAPSKFDEITGAGTWAEVLETLGEHQASTS